MMVGFLREPLDWLGPIRYVYMASGLVVRFGCKCSSCSSVPVGWKRMPYVLRTVDPGRGRGGSAEQEARGRGKRRGNHPGPA